MYKNETLERKIKVKMNISVQNFSIEMPDSTFKKYFYALEVNDKSPMIIEKVNWHIIQIVTYI